MLAMLGWRVVEVPGLPDHGCLVGREQVALVRAGMCACEREETTARLLTLALSRETSTRR